MIVDGVIKPIKLLVVIVDRGKGKNITKLLNSFDVVYNLIALGEGTAPTEFQSYFGFGEPEKDIIFACPSIENLSNVKTALQELISEDTPNSGLAFTIPITSVSGIKELKYILGKTEG